MEQEIILNLTDTWFNVTDAGCMITCEMEAQILQAQYTLMNGVAWGMVLIGFGVFLWGFSVLFKVLIAGMRKESKGKKGVDKPKEEKHEEKGADDGI